MSNSCIATTPISKTYLKITIIELKKIISKISQEEILPNKEGNKLSIFSMVFAIFLSIKI